MRSNPLEDVSSTGQRLVFVSILLYFALYLFGITANEPMALAAGHVLFGAIAIGIGALLYRHSPPGLSPLVAAGVCLVAGGIAQLAWVVTGEIVLELVTTVAVVVGVGLYVYAVWIAN